MRIPSKIEMGSKDEDFVYKKRFKVDKRTPLQTSILHSHYKLPTFARIQPTNLNISHCFYSQKTLFLFLLFSFLIFFPKIQASEDMLFFDPSPMSQDVLEGHDVLLRCDVSNRDKITFHWIYNDKQVELGGRMVQEDSNLMIKKVDRSLHGGSFRCVASKSSTGHAIKSTEAKLNILWISEKAEIISKHFKNSRLAGNDDKFRVVDVEAGSEFAMKCLADGNSDPNVVWLHNEVRIQPSNGVKLIKNRLKLLEGTLKDNGVYRCVADNEAGVRESINRVVLIVHGNSYSYMNPQLDVDSFKPVVIAAPNTDAIIHCTYMYVNKVLWKFNGEPISHLSQKYMIHEHSLVIHNVAHEDEGAYDCNGDDIIYTSVLKLAYIEEMGEDTFSPHNTQEVVVRKGGVIDINCKLPAALPEPSVKWIKRPYFFHSRDAYYSNDRIGYNDFKNDHDDVIMMSNSRLTFPNANVSHTGTYMCITENTAGVRNRSIDVIVTVPPVVTRSPISIRVLEDDEASFDCLVMCTPYPFTVVSWLFNDEPIRTDRTNIEYDQEHAKMLLRGVQLMDQGSYACIVNTTDQHVAISNNAHLYVEKRLKFRPELKDAQMELGKEGHLICKADGKSRPFVRWNRPGGLQKHVNEQEGLLLFNKVKKSDQGMYLCTAQNEQGSINASITLTVFEKPTFKVRPETNVTGVEGRPLLMHCYAVGDPKPTISWFKNNIMIAAKSVNDRIQVLSNGTLVIKEVYMEDFGEYLCLVENIGGEDKSNVFLKVYTSKAYNQLSSEQKNPLNGDSHLVKTVAISLACGAIYLAFVIALTVYCTVRITKAKQLKKNAKNNVIDSNGGDMNQAVNESAGLVPRKELENSSSISTSSYNTRTHLDDYNTLASVRGANKINLFSPILHQTILPHISSDKLYISRYKLKILKLLGQSQYGDVFLGTNPNALYKNNGSDVIMVKSFLIKNESTAEQCLREIDLFGRCDHKNVVKLLGLCVEVEPLFVVLENTEWGDLKKLLLASRDGLIPRITSHQMSSLCSQVALGMEHLYNLGLVHKDLSARNIVLDATLMEAKISYPCLCKDIYAADYFMLSGRLIPLRWMAPEAILDSAETRESDVYSYGVMVWEIYSLGEMPLYTKTNEEVLEGLNSNDNHLSFPVCPIPQNQKILFNDYSNYRINSGSFTNRTSASIKSFPINQLSDCPSNMWRLIQSCTQTNPRLRPRFPDIVLSFYDLTYETVKPRIDD